MATEYIDLTVSFTDRLNLFSAVNTSNLECVSSVLGTLVLTSSPYADVYGKPADVPIIKTVVQGASAPPPNTQIRPLRTAR